MALSCDLSIIFLSPQFVLPGAIVSLRRTDIGFEEVYFVHFPNKENQPVIPATFQEDISPSDQPCEEFYRVLFVRAQKISSSKRVPQMGNSTIILPREDSSQRGAAAGGSKYQLVPMLCCRPSRWVCNFALLFGNSGHVLLGIFTLGQQDFSQPLRCFHAHIPPSLRGRHRFENIHCNNHEPMTRPNSAMDVPCELQSGRLA